MSTNTHLQYLYQELNNKDLPPRFIDMLRPMEKNKIEGIISFHEGQKHKIISLILNESNVELQNKLRNMLEKINKIIENNKILLNQIEEESITISEKEVSNKLTNQKLN